MGWPEAFVVAIGSLQVLGLAWIGTRQQQVKRALNGHADDVTDQLVKLREELGVRPVDGPVRRVFPRET